MSISLKKNIQSTPMGPYASLMRGMDVTDKQAVVAFLIDTMDDDQQLFERLLNDWQHDTRFLSSTKAITTHPSFARIVSMGGNAVPYILEEIERKPSNLVWALNAIFHKKIGQDTTVTEACKLWIAELRKY